MLAAIKSRLPEGVKVFLRKIQKKIKSGSLGRELLSKHYLKGNGMEIGALHNPLMVGSKAHVKYVDRYDNAGLKSIIPNKGIVILSKLTLWMMENFSVKLQIKVRILLSLIIFSRIVKIPC